MKKITTWVFIFIFLYVSPSLLAQKSTPRDNYKLLWKISGNGLKESSYLFGTMHVRDKKVFDFSDSVLVKLEECKSFAMEITPDSILSEAFSILMEEEDNDESNSNDLREHLTEEEYKQLRDKLKNEGLDIEKIKTKSPRKIIKLLSSPIPQKGDKETFLDAYLYRIAKENNMKIVGLEKMKDYASLQKNSYQDEIKELKTYIKYEGPNGIQDLINIYWQGDLSKIENFYIGADTAFLENILYKRNEKMKEKMIELMIDQSTFVAVGAAHLPGERGLIQLLIQNGYTVTPINASFTGLAGKYKEKPLQTDWVRHHVNDQLYSVEFPSQPFLYQKNTLQSAVTKMYIYPDLATGQFYYSLSVPIVTTSDTDVDVFTDKFIKSLISKNKYKLLNKKKILYKSNPGAEALLFDASNKMFVKIKMTVRRNSFYVLMLGSYLEETFQSKEAERFFESLELKAYKNPTWQSFKSEKGAFAINTPFELNKTEQLIPSDAGKVEVKMFNTTDQLKGIMYYVAYYNFSPGIVLTEDSLYIQTTLDYMASGIQGKILHSSDIRLNGFPGKSFTMSATQNMFMTGAIFLRGNRPYVLFAMTSEDKIKGKDVLDFIESFEFTDYKSPHWENYTSSKYNFSVNVPSEVTTTIDTVGVFFSEDYYTETFNSLDRNSGTSYIVNVEKLLTYAFIEKEEFYKTKHTEYITSDDSLIWRKDINLNGIRGIEMLAKIKTTHNYKRLAIFPKGDYMYILLTFMPAKHIEEQDANQFYSSFTFTDSLKESFIFKSKSKQILTDISSSDSATASKAKHSLSSYNFQKTDLPLIYQSLEKGFPDDTNQYWNTRFSLLSHLESLNDQTTIPFLKKLYQNADTNTALKIRVLQPLMYIGTDESLDLFVQLMNEKVPDIDNLPYSFFYPLKDSLALNQKAFPKLFHLFRNKIFRTQIFELASMLMDSSALEASYFDPFKNEILNFAYETLGNKKEVSRDYNYDYSSNNRATIYLLSQIKQDTEISNFLKVASLSKDADVCFEAIKGQLRNNYPIETKNIEKVASSQSLRIELYQALEEKGKVHLYPSMWLTQASFAESSLYNYIYYLDDYPPSKIVLLGSKIKIYKGEQKRFYLFKYSYEDKEWYPGLCGPYSLNKREISTNPEVVNVDYELLNSKSINEHYDYLLKP